MNFSYKAQRATIISLCLIGLGCVVGACISDDTSIRTALVTVTSACVGALGGFISHSNGGSDATDKL